MKNWTTKKVEEVVKDLYDLDVSAKKLSGYEDINFRLDTSRNKNRYLVFKVISESTSIQEIESQHLALAYLKKKVGKKVNVPNPIKSKKGNDIEHFEDQHLRVLTYIEGMVLSDLKNPNIDIYEDLGSSLGILDNAFLNFSHDTLNRELEWDLINFPSKRDNVKFITERDVKECIGFFADRFESFAEEIHPSLRTSPIHNDLNDHNVILDGGSILPSGVKGIIDFGDLINQSLVFDPAIAIAYAIMDSDEPLTIAESFISGYVKKCKLEDIEIEQLYLLVGSRLSHSLLMSAEKRVSDPENEYFQISDQQAREAILKWKSLPEPLVTHVLKRAAGVSFLDDSTEIEKWIEENKDKFDPVMFKLGALDSFEVLDFSVTSNPMDLLDELPLREVASPALGRYLEPRLIYQGDHFKDQGDRRTVHLGVDIFSREGSEVFAPLDGIVYGSADNALEFDYGPTVILEHQTDSQKKFWTLYGHLDRLALKRFKVGQKITKGSLVGNLGSRSVNGNWSPHLHFQLITDILEAKANFPGVANAKYLDVWKKISPNPANLLGVDPNRIAYNLEDNKAIIRQRKKRLSSNLSTSYSDPIKMVIGSGSRLYSENGIEYLDCVNNVCHVGHCHPNVTQALSKQARLLNTNTRYLHNNIIDLSKKLASTLPGQLEVCYFVNSGSEANDLALRLAKTFTGNTDFVVIEDGYHGHTASLIDVSPYKFNGEGGAGPGKNTKMIPRPDTYRGLYREDHANPGKAYADHVDEAIKAIKKSRRKLAGFIGESILSCGGQIVPPQGYLKSVYEKIRAAGGVCIADEVQTGFGRVGDDYWAFQNQGVIPDIVTMGKPMGNGHPLAAVVTTKAIADAFSNGMEYFNTFGGNPVSCAVGLAVLETIESEDLQANAKKVGEYFQSELKDIQSEVGFIGNVRGKGLFLGFEIVKDNESRDPDAHLATMIVEEMKRRKILLSTDGPGHNVIKIKPPLVFSEADVDFVIQNLKFVFNLESESDYVEDSSESPIELQEEETPIENLDSSTMNNGDSDPSSDKEPVLIPKSSVRDNWYGEFKADVVGYDTKVKRYGNSSGKKRRSSKEKGLLGKLKSVLGKD